MSAGLGKGMSAHGRVWEGDGQVRLGLVRLGHKHQPGLGKGMVSFG